MNVHILLFHLHLIKILWTLFVSSSITVSQSVTVRTKELQIFQSVVPVVAVYMVQFQWYLHALPMHQSAMLANMLLDTILKQLFL